MQKPYSDNIIFFDTEFSDLDPYEGEILSVGMIKPSGEELYLELEYDGKVSDWVRDNILPTLTQNKVSREDAKEKIREFIGPSFPYLVSYVNQFDAIYFYKLFGTENQPAYYIPIDFASILFGFGIDPRDYGNKYSRLINKLDVDLSKRQKHNALEDARLLRDIYFRFFERADRLAS
ncbi:MAG: hypothetical protein M1153_02550 [Patescibacteria group bacterium]|nr:hypothetical protein [Patescibacteria group bacterium]